MERECFTQPERSIEVKLDIGRPERSSEILDKIWLFEERSDLSNGPENEWIKSVSSAPMYSTRISTRVSDIITTEGGRIPEAMLMWMARPDESDPKPFGTKEETKRERKQKSRAVPGRQRPNAHRKSCPNPYKMEIWPKIENSKAAKLPRSWKELAKWHINFMLKP